MAYFISQSLGDLLPSICLFTQNRAIYRLHKYIQTSNKAQKQTIVKAAYREISTWAPPTWSVYLFVATSIVWCIARNKSWPLTIFWPISTFGWPKFILVGKTYCKFSMEQQSITYKMSYFQTNWQSFGPYFYHCNYKYMTRPAKIDYLSAKNHWFLVCLLYHNLITIYTTAIKSLSLMQNLMGFLLQLTEMG